MIIPLNSPLPGGSATETHHVFSLLTLIADADAAKARLQELVTEKNASLKAKEEAETAAAHAATREQAALAASKGAEDAIAKNALEKETLAKHSDDLIVREAALEAMTAAVANRETKLRADEATLAKKKAAYEQALQAALTTTRA